MNLVLDNIVFYLQKSGGGSVYWYELISRAVKDKELNVTFIEPKWQLNNFIYTKNSFNLVKRVFETLPLRLLSLINITIPIKDRAIVHSSYYRISKSKNAVNVVTIHDFTPEKYFKGLHKFFQSYRKAIAIKNADAIICISENTKIDLLHYYPKTPVSLINVIYNGVSDVYQKIDIDLKPNYAKEFPFLNEKYMLFIGHRTSYKNFDFAINLLAQCPRYKLVIVGNELSESEIKFLNNMLFGRYIYIKNVSNSTLNIFYNFAHCLLYPSSYEGFGIPVIEAMKVGCPVIARNSSSIPEISGAAALLLDSLSIEKAKQFVAQLEESDFRLNIVEKGIENSRRFSWDKCYSEVKTLYKKLSA